ncbi:MAG: hypothetical protein N3B13_11680, partial [Deltaproteobacteria bacterium]|nr:hypothetical protein [Deltaproteobacteria bacterium]
MKRITFILLNLLIFANCSKEYSVGKIYVVDETQANTKINLSETAENLLKKTKYIGITNPEKSNATLKITLSETNISRDKSKIRNRYNISLTLTATSRENKIQIFQAESSGTSDINHHDIDSQIKTLLYDAIVRLDYQCKIRRYTEDELINMYFEKKTSGWKKSTIIDEMSTRITT